MHNEVISGRAIAHEAAGYVALIDPSTGQVIRGQFFYAFKSDDRSRKFCEFPSWEKRIANWASLAPTYVHALDIDAKGNVLVGGYAVTAYLPTAEYLTSNNKRIGYPKDGSPYIAMFDSSLKLRLRWTTPTQRISADARVEARTGYVASISGGAYCPDDPYHFGACTSAITVTSRAASRGRLYTTANALQVWGSRAYSGEKAHRNDAYAALFRGPAQLASFEVCNPLDMKESPVKLVWAHLSLSRSALDLGFDVVTDSGETAGLKASGPNPRAAIFDNASTQVLGVNCSAIFLEKKLLRVYLGLNHTVKESSDGMADGTHVKLRGGVIYHDRFRDRGESSTASILVTRKLGAPIEARAHLKCPRTAVVPRSDVKPTDTGVVDVVPLEDSKLGACIDARNITLIGVLVRPLAYPWYTGINNVNDDDWHCTAVYPDPTKPANSSVSYHVYVGYTKSRKLVYIHFETAVRDGFAYLSVTNMWWKWSIGEYSGTSQAACLDKGLHDIRNMTSQDIESVTSLSNWGGQAVTSKLTTYEWVRERNVQHFFLTHLQWSIAKNVEMLDVRMCKDKEYEDFITVDARVSTGRIADDGLKYRWQVDVPNAKGDDVAQLERLRHFVSTMNNKPYFRVLKSQLVQKSCNGVGGCPGSNGAVAHKFSVDVTNQDAWGVIEGNPFADTDECEIALLSPVEPRELFTVSWKPNEPPLKTYAPGHAPVPGGQHHAITAAIDAKWPKCIAHLNKDTRVSIK
jgi:hypothetical protein